MFKILFFLAFIARRLQVSSQLSTKMTPGNLIENNTMTVTKKVTTRNLTRNYTPSTILFTKHTYMKTTASYDARRFNPHEKTQPARILEYMEDIRKPYWIGGEKVFLRFTTPRPTTTTTKKGQKTTLNRDPRASPTTTTMAPMDKYRDCDTICPNIYWTYGVCATRYSKLKLYHETRFFPSMCEMEIDNCASLEDGTLRNQIWQDAYDNWYILPYCAADIINNGLYNIYYSLVDHPMADARSDLVVNMHIGLAANGISYIKLSVTNIRHKGRYYEFMIGPGKDGYIKLLNEYKKPLATASTPSINVNFWTWTGLFIRIFEDGRVEYGKEGGPPLISYTEEERLDIQFFSFANQNGRTSYFLFDCPTANSWVAYLKTNNPGLCDVKVHHTTFPNKPKQVLWNADHWAPFVTLPRNWTQKDFAYLYYN